MKTTKLTIELLCMLLLTFSLLSGVNVTGTVVGLDNPTVGLSEATITLSGLSNYTGITNAQGQFTISNVTGSSLYTYTIDKTGYCQASGEIIVSTIDYPMGTVVLVESVNPPLDVTAVENGSNVNIDWSDVVGVNIQYKVWRLMVGQEQNEALWTSLTPNSIGLSNFTDTGWETLPDGIYSWAVKTVYSPNIMSLASFSNSIEKGLEIHYPPENVTAVETYPYAAISWSMLLPEENNSIQINYDRSFLGFKVWMFPEGNDFNEMVWNPITMGTILADSMTYTNWSALGAGTYKFAVKAIYTGYYQSVAAFSNPLVKTTAHAESNIINVSGEMTNCSPNPFNSQTMISYRIKDKAPVKLEIFDAKGRRVKTIVNETKSAGDYRALWNGTNESNKKLSSGVYFYKMTSGKFTSTKKVILVK